MVYRHLAADAGITALVGDRIDHMRAPEGQAMPYLVYRLVSQRPLKSLNRTWGYSVRVQMDAWAENAAEIKAVRTAIIAALEGPDGALLTALGGESVHEAMIEDVETTYSETARLSRLRIDLTFRYNRRETI